MEEHGMWDADGSHSFVPDEDLWGYALYELTHTSGDLLNEFREEFPDVNLNTPIPIPDDTKNEIVAWFYDPWQKADYDDDRMEWEVDCC